MEAPAAAVVILMSIDTELRLLIFFSQNIRVAAWVQLLNIQHKLYTLAASVRYPCTSWHCVGGTYCSIDDSGICVLLVDTCTNIHSIVINS